MDPSLCILRFAVVFVAAFNAENITQKAWLVNKVLFSSGSGGKVVYGNKKTIKRGEKTQKIRKIGLP